MATSGADPDIQENTMAEATRTWLITGCSTGLGRALAEVLIAKGERVFATARKPEELSDLVASHKNARALKLDVTMPTDIKAAVAGSSKRAASTSSSTMPAMAISRRSRRATRMAIAPSSRRTCSA